MKNITQTDRREKKSIQIEEKKTCLGLGLHYDEFEEKALLNSFLDKKEEKYMTSP